MPNKQIQIFILPYAGGSVAAFKRLAELINEKIDVVTVEYAGRGTRAKEPLAKSIWELLEDASNYIIERRQSHLPFALMGYSMGSILAYEMAQQSKIPGGLKHLFISAEISPKNCAIELKKVGNPTDERILERAQKLGGLDERILENKRFADIYIKPMLSDYRLFFQYCYPGYPDKVKVDTTFFYCEKDTAFQDIQKWDELIDGQFDFHELGDNHFFVNTCYRAMANVINANLQLYCTGDEYDI